MPTRRKNIAALIFDIDGTLVDSNDLHARAWQVSFREFGKKIPFAVMREQMGKGGDLLVPDLLNAREIQQFGKKLQIYRKRLFHKEYLPKVRPFRGIRDCFRKLGERNIPLALASSSDNDEVRYYVDLLGVADLIEATTSKDDAQFSKPSPEIFGAALDKLGTVKTRSVAVGDTPYDVLAAHRCALPVIAVRCGGFDDRFLQKAEFIFDSVEELTARIGEIEDYLNE